MQKTKIGYADYTSNPIRAVHDRDNNKPVGWFCTKVNRGCKFCYAERINIRLGNGFKFSRNNEKRVRFFLNSTELEAIEKLRTRDPRTVFIMDMGDLFHEMIDDKMILAVFKEMILTPNITYLVLTKRAKRMSDYIVSTLSKISSLDNIWFGVSASDTDTLREAAEAFEHRPPHTWLSLEPLTGKVENLLPYLQTGGFRLFDQVIVGGESGNNLGIEKIDLENLRAIIGDCRATRTPLYVKQLGSKWAKERGIYSRDSKGEDVLYWPDDLRVRGLLWNISTKADRGLPIKSEV